MECFEGDAFGSLDHFRLIERPIPVPESHQVRIRIEATALGFVDGLMVQGRYQIRPPLPYVPGGEIAGVVDAVGPGVGHLDVGDRVVTWQLGGGLSEYTVVAADEVETVPAGLPSRTPPRCWSTTRPRTTPCSSAAGSQPGRRS